MKINYGVLLLFILVVNTQLYGQKVKLLDNTYYKAFGDGSDIINIVENERSQIIMLLEPSLSSMIEETLSTDTALFRCVLIINIERTNNIFNIYNDKPFFYQDNNKRYENLKISDEITAIVRSIKICPLLNRRNKQKISFGLVFHRK